MRVKTPVPLFLSWASVLVPEHLGCVSHQTVLEPRELRLFFCVCSANLFLPFSGDRAWALSVSPPRGMEIGVSARIIKLAKDVSLFRHWDLFLSPVTKSVLP